MDGARSQEYCHLGGGGGDTARDGTETEVPDTLPTSIARVYTQESSNHPLRFVHFMYTTPLKSFH